MGVKQFFNKAGKGLKTFFGKGGTLDKAFSKGGQVEKVVNQIGSGIDTGLNAVSNVASKVGGVVQQVAPLLTAINPELGIAAGTVGTIAGKVGQGVQKAQNIKKAAIQGYHNPNMPVPSPILAPKPVPEAEDNPVNFA